MRLSQPHNSLFSKLQLFPTHIITTTHYGHCGRPNTLQSLQRTYKSLKLWKITSVTASLVENCVVNVTCGDICFSAATTLHNIL